MYFADEELQYHRALDRTPEERIVGLRPIVAAYAAALTSPLTDGEWQALPWALVRQPLWGIGTWVPEFRATRDAQQHARETVGALRRALPVAAEPDRWQAGLRGLR